MWPIFRVGGEPAQPAHTVHSPHTHVHLHVVAVVKVHEGHVVDVVGEEGGSERRHHQGVGVVCAHYAQEEGEEGEQHCGEGTEVVHHLCEVRVPGVEHDGPDPGIHCCEGVQDPHWEHGGGGRDNLDEPVEHVEITEEVENREECAGRFLDTKYPYKRPFSMELGHLAMTSIHLLHCLPHTVIPAVIHAAPAHHLLRDGLCLLPHLQGLPRPAA